MNTRLQWSQRDTTDICVLDFFFFMAAVFVDVYFSSLQ